MEIETSQLQAFLHRADRSLRFVADDCFAAELKCSDRGRTGTGRDIDGDISRLTCHLQQGFDGVDRLLRGVANIL